MEKKHNCYLSFFVSHTSLGVKKAKKKPHFPKSMALHSKLFKSVAFRSKTQINNCRVNRLYNRVWWNKKKMLWWSALSAFASLIWKTSLLFEPNEKKYFLWIKMACDSIRLDILKQEKNYKSNQRLFLFPWASENCPILIEFFFIAILFVFNEKQKQWFKSWYFYTADQLTKSSQWLHKLKRLHFYIKRVVANRHCRCFD